MNDASTPSDQPSSPASSGVALTPHAQGALLARADGLSDAVVEELVGAVNERVLSQWSVVLSALGVGIAVAGGVAYGAFVAGSIPMGLAWLGSIPTAAVSLFIWRARRRIVEDEARRLRVEPALARRLLRRQIALSARPRTMLAASRLPLRRAEQTAHNAQVARLARDALAKEEREHGTR